MQEVILYLEDAKRNLYPRLLSMLLILAAAAGLSGAAAFLLCGYAGAGSFAVTGGSGLKDAMLSRAPMMVTVLIIYLSAFTVFNRAAVVLAGALRGASMGCFLALSVSGRIYGIGGDWAAGFALSLLETLVLLLYCAYSSVYSEPILVTRLSGNGVMSSSLGWEFTKCTSVFSGAVFVLGAASRALIL